MTSDPVLTAAEVAAELRISKMQVLRLVKGDVRDTPRLPCIKIGKRPLVPRSVLDKWKAENLSGGIIAPGSEEDTVTHSKGVN